MKANKKFRSQNDRAVSPVIAVILMVAITVVLSATVYVWVSGFGGNKAMPSRAVTLISDGPITSGGVKSFSISGADPSLRFADIGFTKNGVSLTYDTTCAPSSATTLGVCRGSTVLTAAALVQAGDTLKLQASAGDVLRILDLQANSVLYTVTIG